MMLATVAAWAMLQASAARETHFTVPDGFVVDRPSDLGGSLISLAFGPDGSAYVGRESAGIVRLSDADHDGRFERSDELAAELTMCQGLAVIDGALIATGSIDKKIGLWRVPLDLDGLRSGAAERLFEFTDGGEHGPHGVVRGPDGSVYVTVGNHAAFSDAASHAGGYWSGDEGRLLPPYMDPLGHGTHVRYPGGFVARVDLEKRTWQYVAVGLRNAYDLAFDNKGYPFAVDSDMEWDVGLPWYRPVRLIEIIEGADYGSRAGSGVIPEWCPDTEPAILNLGRGSPTGAVFGTRTHFPDRWRWAMFSGDWAQGKILAVWTGEDASGVAASSSDFLKADTALPITDVEIGPKGALWFLTGGRGVRGGAYRVSYPGGEPGAMSNQTTRTLERSFVEQAASESIAGGEEPWKLHWPAYSPTPLWRSLWPLMARTYSSYANAAAIDQLRSPRDIQERIGALYVLAPPARVETRADRIATLALDCLNDPSLVQQPNAELTLAALRGLELGLLRQGQPQRDLATRLGARLLSMFPSEDARICGEVGVLLSYLDDARALGPLVDEMLKSPQELAIHYADCVHRMTNGWDGTRRRVMLEWFAKSSEYKGGISLPGYLTAMRARFIADLPLDACGELAAEPGLDAESLALLFARGPADVAVKNFPRFEQSLALIVPRKYGTSEQARKDAALRALSPLQVPAVQELARKLALSEGDVLEAPWMLLARRPDARDFELWLGAIVSPSAAKRENSLAALSKIARAPAGAAEWRSLIDHAREIGSRRGRELARMLVNWCRSAGATTPAGELSTPAEFEAALVVLDTWYAAQFPQGKGPASLEPSPRWPEEEILAFLARAKPRPGSAFLGRAVFEAAGCNACHAVGTTPANDRRGLGPDLANVSDRLSDADLLAAIVAPSRVVSDQYRAFIALTTDDRLFEGIVTRRDAQGIEIRPTGQEPIEIDAEDLESLEPSLRSPMPDGLLDSRTLEEIRDLFAYMQAGREGSAAANWSPLLGPGGISGWDGDAAVWTLRGATLFGRSSGLARSSYLLAPLPAQDMLVEFDVFLPPGGNSGLCYRAQRPEDTALSDPSGAQADLGQSYWGSLYAADGRTLAAPDAVRLEAALDRSGWNHVLVRFEGDLHSMEINGLETYSTRAEIPPGALFGFQVHQGKPMQVRFANARWRAP